MKVDHAKLPGGYIIGPPAKRWTDAEWAESLQAQIAIQAAIVKGTYKSHSVPVVSYAEDKAAI